MLATRGGAVGRLGFGWDVVRLGVVSTVDATGLRKPRSLGRTPHGVQAVTVPWLDAALCAAAPGAKVLDFQPGEGSSGTTTRQIMKIQYNNRGEEAGLPASVFAKAAPQYRSRMTAGMCGALANEFGFYRSIRPELDIETPDSYYLSYEPWTQRTMLLLEDVATTRGASFPEAQEFHIDRARAEQMMRLMASYHAAFWNDPRLDTQFEWLKDRPRRYRDNIALIHLKDGAQRGLVESRDLLPAELVADGHRIWPAFLEAADADLNTPRTLLHGDVHVGNWYLREDESLGLCDWQCTVRGVWAVDIAYALSSALTVGDRRSWERELLELYLEALDVPERPSFAAAWDQYRAQMMHGFVNWLYTIAPGRLQPDMQKRVISESNVWRMGQAVVDLESLSAIENGLHLP